MKEFFVIRERATGIVMVVSEDFKEILNIFSKYYGNRHFILCNNMGKEISIYENN